MHPKKISVNGTELHYIEHGEGVPVVFVHGGLGDYRTWRGQVIAFSKYYRAVSYSRRGHYPNALPSPGDLSSMEPHIEDLAELIDKLELGRAHIVANSYGGYISLFVALRYPEKVRTLVLAEPPVYPLLLRLPGGQALFDEFVDKAWYPAREAYKQGDMEEGTRLFLDGAVGEGIWEGLPRRVQEEMLKDAPELAAAAATPFEHHMPEFSCEDAAKIEAPTLLLLGELSPKKYSLINNELARCIPHAEQAGIPRAAHVLHSQNPEDHNRVALAFLERH